MEPISEEKRAAVLTASCDFMKDPKSLREVLRGMHMVNSADGFQIWTEKYMSSSMVTQRGYTCRVVSIRDRDVLAGRTDSQRHAK